mmetsp:Transcript_26559/g.47239  ORF Transcript_26559/g.47239 Transcript_26559/m.47239 type:complete len:80 (+) Transcript_26559:409-648(+)
MGPDNDNDYDNDNDNGSKVGGCCNKKKGEDGEEVSRKKKEADHRVLILYPPANTESPSKEETFHFPTDFVTEDRKDEME